MILVTGGTGFIGAHLVRRLAASGQAVRCLVRRQASPRNLPSGVEAVYGNLISGEGLPEALRGTDTVIHLAGVTKALAPADYYAGNALATRNLLGALAAALAGGLAGRGPRLVHVSSLAAVGPSLDGKPIAEDAEPHPLSHYGKSKLEAERAVQELAPDAVIVRPPVVYGPGDTDVFPLLKSISKGFVLRLGGGERWFSAIYVEDLVEGLITAAGSTGLQQINGARGRTYFLAHAKPVSWSQFGAAAARIMNRTPRVLEVPAAIAHVAGWGAEIWSRITRKPGIVSREKVAEAQCKFWTCDVGRAARELGFQAPTSLENGLAETLACYKEAGWLTY
ncbi:MAG TPA: NAD-dependent epimerase/dehydratase family protein [Candidatus Acidoferrales bacterium]|jgi:dihydroflavonol-4-reductase|nr:NAD-dependent epimerase/dehydratase family protein [Candidatus Acidoferrales bacterium]